MWCSQSGNHSQSNLTKFGCILDMKVDFKKNRILLYAWLLAGTYHKCVANFFFKLQNLAKLAHFMLCIGRNHVFSGRNLAKIRQVMKHWSDPKPLSTKVGWIHPIHNCSFGGSSCLFPQHFIWQQTAAMWWALSNWLENFLLLIMLVTISHLV